jgi:hypothetical protein
MVSVSSLPIRTLLSIPLLLVSPYSNRRGQSPMPHPEQREGLQTMETMAPAPQIANYAAVSAARVGDVVGAKKILRESVHRRRERLMIS